MWTSSAATLGSQHCHHHNSVNRRDTVGMTCLLQSSCVILLLGSSTLPNGGSSELARPTVSSPSRDRRLSKSHWSLSYRFTHSVRSFLSLSRYCTVWGAPRQYYPPGSLKVSMGKCLGLHKRNCSFRDGVSWRGMSEEAFFPLISHQRRYHTI